MASEEHPPVYNDDDLDDDDDDSEPLNGAVPDDDDAVAGDSESSSETDDGDANSTAAVTVAIPTSVAAPSSSVTVALPDPKRQDVSPVVPPEKKPIDDSRRLFQRLWTDEDEIELLQGFLDYTSTRGTSGHHHDTAAFYDQIKSKLQLDFNKNQLVEKLRRLKKKYRNVLSKMSSGKEFVFKSPHDQATFEISRKIWSNTPVNHRGAVELDDDDQNPNPNSVVSATPPHNSYAISHINLNNAATPSDHRAGNTPVSFDMMGSNLSTIAASKLSSRKRPRVGKLEDKFVRVNLGGSGSSEGGNVHSNNNNNNNNNNNSNNNSSNIGVGTAMQGLIAETVKNCLVPVFKELMNNAVNGVALGNGVGGAGIKGVGALAMNAIPLNFSGVNLGNNGEVMDEKWRKQQILELEVYSKRLELVQDQIKSTLEELRSLGKVRYGSISILSKGVISKLSSFEYGRGVIVHWRN
ncbi:hypothetical protein Cgig2_003503 [Carnegiea gigantea]|uniref:Glabrous enhancer-binding protein-like DBD domain-containing protein n=1 Tax=Carnegiea gigantea TaxID=171969 RepID=A0A9Q1KC63_9CARY|nr:hypothetical protein Cgig2_003503 [Carnegiea gigantea]